MAALRQAGYAVGARYDRSTGRVVVALNTEVEISFPAQSAEGLADASPDDLSAIEISASGLGACPGNEFRGWWADAILG